MKKILLSVALMLVGFTQIQAADMTGKNVSIHPGPGGHWDGGEPAHGGV